MNKTPNYQLSQWTRVDRVLMDDFNADNAKIDAALKADADALAAADAVLTAALQKKGNCQIVYTTYVGTGEYGPDHPNTLTFDAPPMLIFICGDYIRMGFLFRNWELTRPTNTETGGFHAAWRENSVSWYNSYDADDQYNSRNNTYHVIAFLKVS